MGKRSPNAHRSIDAPQAAEAAELVRRDFSALLEIFENQLATLPRVDGERHSHLSDAKAAAQRGLQLSQKLIEMLRARD